MVFFSSAVFVVLMICTNVYALLNRGTSMAALHSTVWISSRCGVYLVTNSMALVWLDKCVYIC